jgi:hypothetical protein
MSVAHIKLSSFILSFLGKDELIDGEQDVVRDEFR